MNKEEILADIDNTIGSMCMGDQYRSSTSMDENSNCIIRNLSFIANNLYAIGRLMALELRCKTINEGMLTNDIVNQVMDDLQKEPQPEDPVEDHKADEVF